MWQRGRSFWKAQATKLTNVHKPKKNYARPRWNRCVCQVHDDFVEYASWVADAFEIVDLRSGEIRSREINEWLLDEAIAKMAQLDHPDVVKMSERLQKHKPYLLCYLDWLETQLSPLQAELHAYLHEPELEKVLLQAVGRKWRLQHEVQSMQRRAFRPSLKQAEQVRNGHNAHRTLAAD